MNNRSKNSSLRTVLLNILISIYQIFLMTGLFVFWVIQSLLPERWLELAKKFMTKAYSVTESALSTFLATLSELVHWISEIGQDKKQK